MTPSLACIALIRNFEQCRLKAFRPTPRDVPTIGWGRTRGVRITDICTQAQADQWLLDDVAEKAVGVDRLLDGAPTTQGQYDALVSFTYNEGLGNPNIPDKGLAPSTLLRLHKAGDYAGAAAEFPKWVKQSGITLGGLVRRRAAERAMYLGET